MKISVDRRVDRSMQLRIEVNGELLAGDFSRSFAELFHDHIRIRAKIADLFVREAHAK